MSTIIKLVPGDFEQAYADLTELHDSLKTYKTALKSRYNSLGASWKGAAGSAFNEHVPKLLENYETLLTNMQDMAQDIQKYGEELQQLDKRMANSM